MAELKKRIQVYLPVVVVDRLDRIAEEYATSRSQAVVIATRNFRLTERMREGVYTPEEDK